MTNKEAIQLLEDVKSRVECFDVYIDKKEGEALELAIKALTITPKKALMNKLKGEEK